MPDHPDPDYRVPDRPVPGSFLCHIVGLRRHSGLQVAAAALLLGLPGVARAQDACLTPREFTQLATYALPGVVNGVSERCTPVLPADAYLRQHGAALARSYGPARAAAWPGAKSAFWKLSGAAGQSADTLRALPDTTQQQFVDALTVTAVVQHLPTDRCAAIDRALALLSPLPPESAAELIGLAAGFGARSGAAHIGPIAICGG